MTDETIGERIREARERAGLSQTELADRVGVRVPTMYRYERRGMVPRAATLARIADELGVTPQWIIEGGPAPEPQSRNARERNEPAHWSAFLDNYEYLDALSDADLSAMKSFAARTHRIRSWYDWAQLAEWLRNRKPSKIFEEATSATDEEP